MQILKSFVPRSLVLSSSTYFSAFLNRASLQKRRITFLAYYRIKRQTVLCQWYGNIRTLKGNLWELILAPQREKGSRTGVGRFQMSRGLAECDFPAYIGGNFKNLIPMRRASLILLVRSFSFSLFLSFPLSVCSSHEEETRGTFSVLHARRNDTRASATA